MNIEYKHKYEKYKQKYLILRLLSKLFYKKNIIDKNIIDKNIIDKNIIDKNIIDKNIIDKNTTFNLRIYEYLLDGYTHSRLHKPYYTTNLIKNDTQNCTKIKVIDKDKLDETENNIRSCDSLDGYLSTEQPDDILLQENLFFINYNNIKIKSNDLIMFTTMYGAKELDRIKITNFDKIPSMETLYNEQNITIIINNYKELVKLDWNNYDNNNDDNTLIKYIDGTDKRFIIIGDLHGSFATFVRLLLRFKIMGVFDDMCIIQPKYNIIFLGDIIDRGVYGFEIMIIILLLKLINPNNIFVNRGNHEEKDINYKNGFRDHIMMQFNSDNIFDLFNSSFVYSHSALLIHNNLSNKYIYLAHGGLPLTPTGELYDSWIDKKNKIILNSEISNNINQSNSIRWSDFYGGYDTLEVGTRGYTIGKKIIDSAKQNNIELIIRAHQDRISNTKILMFNNKKNDESFKSFQDIDKTDNKMSCKDFIHKLDIRNDDIYINDIKENYLPVVVLTTNTDTGRDLNHDSFAMLTFIRDDFHNSRDCSIDQNKS
jgi:hypothetical protein